MARPFPIFCVLLGLLMLGLSLFGLASHEIPFWAKRISPYYRFYSLEADPILYWFFEALCFVGGLAFSAFGAKELRS